MNNVKPIDFNHANLVKHLLWYDGPLISHYTWNTLDNGDIQCLVVNLEFGPTLDSNLAAVFDSSVHFEEYIKGKISLLEVYKTCQMFMLLDKPTHIIMTPIKFEELEESILPTADSFHEEG